MAALGAELAPGFALVAEQTGLEAALDGVELVITGEGKLDSTSFAGKVVGGVLELCARRGIPALVVAGEIEHGTECPVTAISLSERFGYTRSWSAPASCIADSVAAALRGGRAGRESGTER